MAERRLQAGPRRIAAWVMLVTAAAVALGVLLQGFSIAAYARGAGPDALDLHEQAGFIVHALEVVVLIAALVAFWGAWRAVLMPALLAVIGTLQIGAVGDTDASGGWVNGLHGLLAMIVLLLAVAVVHAVWRLLVTPAEPVG